MAVDADKFDPDLDDFRVSLGSDELHDEDEGSLITSDLADIAKSEIDLGSASAGSGRGTRTT